MSPAARDHRGPRSIAQADEVTRIVKAIEAGTSVSLVAREFGVSTRTAYRYVRRLRGGGSVEPVEPWVAACMEPDEWALWVEMNPRNVQGGMADRPCRDCPASFAREMRAVGRCNGYPQGRFEPAEEEEPVEITRARAKPVQVDLALPSCDDCIHRVVCAIRPTLEDLDTATDVELPSLNAALTPRLALSIECGFYVRDKAVPREKPEPKKRNWTPEQRQAAADRLNAARDRRAAERAEATA